MIAPALALMRGVRPISLIQTTSVSSNMPRLLRSSSRADSPWSVGGNSVFFSALKLSLWVSQSRLPNE